MYNILTEPLIRIATVNGVCRATLPDVLATLMADKVEAFPALRPHQCHAWHAFLVQLGAMAMHRAGVSKPPTDAAEWAGLISGLTPEWLDDEPWHVVVDDITKPAFMQPPASSPDKRKDYKSVVATPDELDIISVSRNHSVKNGIVQDGEIDDWLFALIDVQTMDGRPGNGYYGISRMNSNDGSRTAFSLTPSLRWGQHVSKDMASLLEANFSGWPMRWDGINLLWTECWNGNKSEALNLDKLHPYYLEICRRCRLGIGDNGLYAVKAANVKGGGCRIAAEENRGNVGDPWTLITEDKTGPKALTMQQDSFSYRNIASYLFSPDWKLPALFNLSQTGIKSDAYLVARALRRKKGGQTEGYYERVIPLRPKAIQVFGRMSGQQRLGDIARERIVQIGKVKDALRCAVAAFATDGGSSNARSEIWSLANPWSNKLDEIIDARFFEDLQDEFEHDDQSGRDSVRKRWLRNGKDGVIDHAAKILLAAEDMLPCLSIHRYKARVAADGVFLGRLSGPNGLPELFDRNDTNQEDNECPNNDQPTAPTPNPTKTQMTLFT